MIITTTEAHCQRTADTTMKGVRNEYQQPMPKIDLIVFSEICNTSQLPPHGAQPRCQLIILCIDADFIDADLVHSGL